MPVLVATKHQNERLTLVPTHNSKHTNMVRHLCFEEVELHNTEQDCWVVLGPAGAQLVYDLTAFLEDHPGGPELLLDLAGQDVHEEFEVPYQYVE